MILIIFWGSLALLCFSIAFDYDVMLDAILNASAALTLFCMVFFAGRVLFHSEKAKKTHRLLEEFAEEKNIFTHEIEYFVSYTGKSGIAIVDDAKNILLIAHRAGHDSKVLMANYADILSAEVRKDDVSSASLTKNGIHYNPVVQRADGKKPSAKREIIIHTRKKQLPIIKLEFESMAELELCASRLSLAFS